MPKTSQNFLAPRGFRGASKQGAASFLKGVCQTLESFKFLLFFLNKFVFVERDIINNSFLLLMQVGGGGA